MPPVNAGAMIRKPLLMPSSVNWRRQGQESRKNRNRIRGSAMDNGEMLSRLREIENYLKYIMLSVFVIAAGVTIIVFK